MEVRLHQAEHPFSSGIRTAVRLAVITGLMSITACAGVHLPWRQPAPPPPEPSTALNISFPGVVLPQYWKRNTVVVDLSGVSGQGTAVIQPTQGHAWPVRLALRVRPGSVGMLEVRGDQRWVVPVAITGAPVDLELPPGLYTRSTEHLTVSWGDATAPAQ